MKNINESGRSLVEMLGVLGIIGVLSIGGISGYDMVISKRNATSIYDVAAKLSSEARIKSVESGYAFATLQDLDMADQVVGECASDMKAYQDGVVVVNGCKVDGDIARDLKSIAGIHYCDSTPEEGSAIILNIRHRGSEPCSNAFP